MSYFSFFPTRINYPITVVNATNTDQIKFKISFPDFFRNAAISFPSIMDGDFYYEKINLLDGERPDQLSYRLYGTSKYYWTFFIINDHLRLGESLQWALSRKQLLQKIDTDYDGLCITSFKSRFIRKIKPPISFLKDNFIFNKFEFGETVEGTLSGTTGTVVDVRPNFGQVILKNISSPNPLFDQTFSIGESIRGLSSNTSLICDQVVEYKKATYEYIDILTGRIINNRNFIYTERPDVDIRVGSISFEKNLESINDNLSSLRVLNKKSVMKFAATYSKAIASSTSNSRFSG